jgi:hypothetical protein
VDHLVVWAEEEELHHLEWVEAEELYRVKQKLQLHREQVSHHLSHRPRRINKKQKKKLSQNLL